MLQIEQVETMLKRCEQSDLLYFRYTQCEEEIVFSKTHNIPLSLLTGGEEKPAAASRNLPPSMNQEQLIECYSDVDKSEKDNQTTLQSSFVGIITLDGVIKDNSLPIAVEKGQDLCVIEAMKIYNSVQAPEAGYIDTVLIEDGDVVEYGHTLFHFRKKQYDKI